MAVGWSLVLSGRYCWPQTVCRGSTILTMAFGVGYRLFLLIVTLLPKNRTKTLVANLTMNFQVSLIGRSKVIWTGKNRASILHKQSQSRYREHNSSQPHQVLKVYLCNHLIYKQILLIYDVEVYNVVYKKYKYLWLKNGFYYFQRHVLADVQKHYERSCIVICLKTKS